MVLKIYLCKLYNAVELVCESPDVRRPVPARLPVPGGPVQPVQHGLAHLLVQVPDHVVQDVPRHRYS